VQSPCSERPRLFWPRPNYFTNWQGLKPTLAVDGANPLCALSNRCHSDYASYTVFPKALAATKLRSVVLPQYGPTSLRVTAARSGRGGYIGAVAVRASTIPSMSVPTSRDVLSQLMDRLD
jgi:hypothetical protein